MESQLMPQECCFRQTPALRISNGQLQSIQGLLTNKELSESVIAIYPPIHRDSPSLVVVVDGKKKNDVIRFVKLQAFPVILKWGVPEELMKAS